MKKMDRKKWSLWGYRVIAAAFFFGCVYGSFWFLHHYLEQAQEAASETSFRPDGQKAAGETRSRPDGQKAVGETRSRIDGQRSGNGTASRQTKEREKDGDRAAEQKKESNGLEQQEKVCREKHAEMKIRVGILGDNYETKYHQELVITSAGKLVTEYRGSGETVAVPDPETGESRFCIRAEEMKEGDVCTVTPNSEDDVLVLPELVRAQAAPQYSGTLILYRETEGIRLVNELPLEAYLCSVVSSEMPSDYPEQALMAQAVCARTYAWNCMAREKNSDRNQDLDDSVLFQVYNNQGSCDASERAVKATEGEILPLDEALYYSTSCGTEGREDLSDGQSFWHFLQQEPAEEEEYGSPWVRWEIVLPQASILERMQETYGFSGSEIEKLEVTQRSPNGQALELQVSGSGESAFVSGEYEIRSVLAPGEAAVLLRNGQEVRNTVLLPSAWFCIASPEAEQGVGFTLIGGGYGHGRGMSQCGAAQMAQDGAGYREILEYYYGESELLHVEDS